MTLFEFWFLLIVAVGAIGTMLALGVSDRGWD